MSDHNGNHDASTVRASIKSAVEGAIDGAACEVRGGGGHYEISVRAQAFHGQSLLNQQRMVLSAIAHLMKGEDAPVHAVDKIETLS